MITRSGTELTRDTGVMSPEDIAHSLAQMPRFAGQLEERWTVLEHSLFVEELAAEQDYGDRQRMRAVRIAALLHDAHEAVTGDITTHFKTVGMRGLQAGLDVRIMDAYMPGGYLAYRALEPLVKELDHRALLAEALVLHPAITSENIEHYFGGAPDPDDVARLKRFLLRSYPPAAFLRKYRQLFTLLV